MVLDTIQVAEYTIQNTEYTIHNTEYRIDKREQNTEQWIPSGCSVQNTDDRIQNTGYRIQSTRTTGESGIQVSGYAVYKSDHRIQTEQKREYTNWKLSNMRGTEHKTHK